MPTDEASAEERFLAFARQRDQAALESLLREHLPLSREYALRVLGNAADADEAIQEAVTRLALTAGAYDGTVPFRAWLARLVQVSTIDHARRRTRRSRHERALPEEYPAQRAPDDSGQSALVRRALGELPDEVREPLELHYLAGLSHHQVAQALGISKEAASKRIQRGKERLTEHLRRLGVERGMAALLVLAPPVARRAWRGSLARLAAAALSVVAALSVLTVALIARSRPATAPSASTPTSGAPAVASATPSPAETRNAAPPAAVGDLLMAADTPRLSLGMAAGGPPQSLLTLRMDIWGLAGRTVPYEIVVDGASRGLSHAAPASPGAFSGQPVESWTVSPGRHRIEVRLDPANEIAETDETNNDSLVIVDVPVAAAPTPVAGADLAFAYPPYVIFTPLPPLNRGGGAYWQYQVRTQVVNNGTVPVPRIDVAVAHDGRIGMNHNEGDYRSDAVADNGDGGSIPPSAPQHVVVTIDPDHRVDEADRANNVFTFDFVSPPEERGR